jgi:AraC-like DNA-binding protein
LGRVSSGSGEEAAQLLVPEGAAVADPAISPVRSSSFTAQHADEITEFIRRMFVGNRSSFTAARDRQSRFRARVGAVADVSCSRVRSTIDYRVATEPFDSFVFFAVRGGRIRVRDGVDDVGAPAGEVGFHPLGVPLDASAEDMDAHFLQLPRTRLDQVATEVAGVAPGELRFHAITPVSPAMRRYWWSMMALLGGAALAADSPLSSPLVAEEMIRAAAVGALEVFPNTTMTRQYQPGPQGVGPAALRRAVAFIDANAERAVTLSDVAAAAGTGPRALQSAFRRHYGTTPLGYARRVRLEHAHRALQAADPARGDTVAAVAIRWGFAKPDRFAAYYRDAYGTLPSHTLRR